jgi:hypothetical protein
LKIAAIITSIFLLLGCSKSNFDSLNNSIINSRKEIRNENFKGQLRRMDDFRKDFLQYVSNKYNLNLENRRDTLILVEYFDNICPTCSFYDITLLNDNITFKIDDVNWKKKVINHKINVDTLSYYKHGNLIGDGLWKLKVNKSNKNPFDKNLYSSPCFDGSRANITWILPNQRIISVHADCFL